jgi:hypothetical protein
MVLWIIIIILQRRIAMKKDKVIGGAIIAGLSALAVCSYVFIAKPSFDKKNNVHLADTAETSVSYSETETAVTAVTTAPASTTAPEITTVATEKKLSITPITAPPKPKITTAAPAETKAPAAATAPAKTTAAKTTKATAKTKPPVVTLNAKPQTEVVKEEENAATDANGKPTRQGKYDEEKIKINGNEFVWMANVKQWANADNDGKTTIMDVKSDGYKNPLTDTGAIDLSKVVTPKGKVISYERYLEIKAGGYQTDD